MKSPKTNVPPSKNSLSDKAEESAIPIYHLMHDSAAGKALCGVPARDVKIGTYVEHLVTQGDRVEWVREIFGADGKPVSEVCRICLTIYPSNLSKVNPFDVCIKLHFEANKTLRNSYDVSASGTATIGDIRKEIVVSPAIGSFTAQWIGDLRFPVHVNLAPIVPWVEQANKQHTKGEG